LKPTVKSISPSRFPDDQSSLSIFLIVRWMESFAQTLQRRKEHIEDRR